MAQLKKQPKYFFAYKTAMSELDISRRTLQRWIDDMEILPMEFEDHLKVFLSLPSMERLREYSKVMQTKNSILINRYRTAVATGNIRMLNKIRKGLIDV